VVPYDQPSLPAAPRRAEARLRRPLCRRLLDVKHCEENEKPCLYLVGTTLHTRRGPRLRKAAAAACCLPARRGRATEGRLRWAAQVFEYLNTDLKKYMDRNGKGPAHPLDPRLVKVRPDQAEGRLRWLTMHRGGAGACAPGSSWCAGQAEPTLCPQPDRRPARGRRRTCCTSCARAWRTATSTA
jgi:hypothetical protein